MSIEKKLSLDESVSTTEKSSTSPKKSATSNVESTSISVRTKAPPSKAFNFKKKSKKSTKTEKLMTTSEKLSSEPIENVMNSTTLTKKSPIVPPIMLDLDAQEFGAEGPRKGVEDSVSMNLVLETIDASKNPHNQTDVVVVTKRRSKHRSDKRPPPDSADQNKSLRKRRKKRKKNKETVESSVLCG